MADENNDNRSSTEREDAVIEQLVPWLVASVEAKRNWSDAYVGATLPAMTERGGKMNGIVSRRRTTGASMGRQCDRLQGEHTEMEVNLRLAKENYAEMRRECNERAAEMKAAADVYLRLRDEFNDSVNMTEHAEKDCAEWQNEMELKSEALEISGSIEERISEGCEFLRSSVVAFVLSVTFLIVLFPPNHLPSPFHLL